MSAAAALWLAVVIVFVLWVAALVAFVLARRNPGRIKGWTGEQRTRWLHLRRLDTQSYTTVHDLYLPRPGSTDTTQVDHIVVSQFGVFVIETKNLSGWIHGSEKQRNWTITYRSREKRQIQNPLRQNHLHVLAVAEYCDLAPELIHSYVFLVGDAQPKRMAEMGPKVIYRHGLIEKIRSHQTVVLDDAAVHTCIARLQAAKKQVNRAMREAHLRALEERHPRS